MKSILLFTIVVVYGLFSPLLLTSADPCYDFDYNDENTWFYYNRSLSCVFCPLSPPYCPFNSTTDPIENCVECVATYCPWLDNVKTYLCGE